MALEKVSKREDEELECLKELKRRVKDEEELNVFNLDDRFLLHFVRGRKYNVDKAFETLKNYIRVRREAYPAFFNKIQPQTSKGLKQRVCRAFRDSATTDTRIGIVRIEWWDPNVLTLDDVLEAGVLFLEEAWNNTDVELNGMLGILDCQGFSFKHLKQCTMPMLKKLHELIWNAFPIRFKALHIVNEPYYFKVIYNIFYPFVPTKMRTRTHFHGSDRASLHKNIPRDVLPESLGGPYAEDDENIWDVEVEEKTLNKEMELFWL